MRFGGLRMGHSDLHNWLAPTHQSCLICVDVGVWIILHFDTLHTDVSNDGGPDAVSLLGFTPECDSNVIAAL